MTSPAQALQAATAIQYTGTVADRQGQPIANALVVMPASGDATQTDAAGRYSLDGEIETAATHMLRETTPTGITFNNGILSFQLADDGPVSVTMYDLGGRVRRNVPALSVINGRNGIRLFEAMRPLAVSLVQITTASGNIAFSCTGNNGTLPHPRNNSVRRQHLRGKQYRVEPPFTPQSCQKRPHCAFGNRQGGL